MPEPRVRHGRGAEMRTLFAFMRPQRRLTAHAAVASVLRVFVRLLPSLVAVLVFDFVLRQRPVTLGPFTLGGEEVLLLGGAIIALTLALEAPLLYVQRLCGETSGQRTIYAIRRASFAKLQRLPTEFFQVRNGGKMILRFTGDLSAILWLAGRGLVDVLVDVVTLLTVTVALLWLDPLLATISLFAVPFLLFALRQENGPLREEGRTVRQQRADIAGELQEQFLNPAATRGLADPDTTIRAFDADNRHLRDGLIGLARRGARLESAGTLVAGAMGGATLLFGAWLALQGRNSVGELAAFSYLAALTFPVYRRMGRYVARYNRALVGLERVVALLTAEEPDAPPRRGRGADGDDSCPPLVVREGAIMLRDVTFAHTEKRGPVFDRLWFPFPAGGVTSVYGGTGAGKSTLATLLAGQATPDTGAVLLDGQSLVGCDPASVRRAVVLVEQEAELFADTLRSNICYGWDWRAEGLSAKGRDARIRRFTELVGLSDFIAELPSGYRTKAGQRGVRLSVRQRQGIALVRALVRRPALLVIDGAESFCDAALVERLRAFVRSPEDGMSTRSTVIVMSADPALARVADHRVVLEDGTLRVDDRVERPIGVA